MTRLLDELLQRYPDDPSMRQAALLSEFRRRKAATKLAAMPQTGVYYWLPKPSAAKPGSFIWDLATFFASDYSNGVLHYDVWPEALELLAIWWKKDPAVLKRVLREAYGSVPRGRVVRMKGGFGLAHGNDTPSGQLGLRAVVRAFNLQGVKLTPYFDEHERPIMGDPEQLVHALKTNFGVKSVNPFEEEGEVA